MSQEVCSSSRITTQVVSNVEKMELTVSTVFTAVCLMKCSRHASVNNFTMLSVCVTGTVKTSAGLLKTYPEDKVEEKKQELHTLHSSLHVVLKFGFWKTTRERPSDVWTTLQTCLPLSLSVSPGFSCMTWAPEQLCHLHLTEKLWAQIQKCQMANVGDFSKTLNPELFELDFPSVASHFKTKEKS